MVLLSPTYIAAQWLECPSRMLNPATDEAFHMKRSLDHTRAQGSQPSTESCCMLYPLSGLMNLELFSAAATGRVKSVPTPNLLQSGAQGPFLGDVGLTPPQADMEFEPKSPTSWAHDLNARYWIKQAAAASLPVPVS